MSDTPSPSQGGGKTPRDKRRLSSDPPYKKLRSSASAMPVATRHSPARDQPAPVGPVPIGDIMQELSLLRKSMENRFTEAGKQSEALRAEVVGKLEANDQAVSELQLAITDVTLSVDQNQRAIHEVRAEVERREVELPDKVRAIVNEALDRQSRAPGSKGPPASSVRPRRLGNLAQAVPPDPTSAKEDAYLIARRSLRLWPVSREGSLAERTREFLVNELCMDQQYAASLNFVVKRTGGPAAKPTSDPARPIQVKDEVLVRFDSTRERDDVRSFAKNLERKGRGLRLEVPDHLWPSFRVLQQLGYELRLKNPNLRRNVLFDDVNCDLKMDFSTDTGTTWKTVSPSEARRSLEKCRPSRARKASVGREELDSMLGEPDVETRMEEEY